MCEQKRRISLNHPKNFKCQAFDKAAYREPADDWSIEPETLQRSLFIFRVIQKHYSQSASSLNIWSKYSTRLYLECS